MLSSSAGSLPLAVPLAVLLAVVVGLAVGSFLNVVIARVPAGESVVRPGSRCPRCGTAIAPRDNVPLLGWLLLRGRGRCCGAPIGARYPLVEAGTAIAFGGVAWWALDRPATAWALPAFLYLAGISIALALIDLDTFRLPFVIVAPAYPVSLVLLGAASWAAHDGRSAVRMVIGGALLWGLYRLLHQLYPAGMGYGDVRLAGVLGLYLGWLGWSALAVGAFLGFLVGGVVGVVLLATRRTKLRSAIPYGPYLLAGAWLGVVAGAPIGHWYLRGMGL
jgi:leader peptidase (prepilin peptidase)/N-methyltransferase